MNRELVVIKCPTCGREYLPAEIFLPDAFFGRPEIIKRNAEGSIVDYIGADMDTVEKFQCDSCNTVFISTAVVKFNTTVSEDDNITSNVTASRFKLKDF